MSIRARSILLAFASIAALSACGPTNNTTPTPGPGSSTSSSSTSTATSRSSTGYDSTGGITVGSVVFQSTLKPPSNDFGVNGNVSEDDNGITLKVDHANGGYTFTELKDFHSIPQNLAVHVFAKEATESGIYYGVACRGYGQNEKYLLLADNTGKWVIVQVSNGNQKLLKQGTADGVDAGKSVQIDAACVTPASNDQMNHLVLALNGKVVGTVDDDFHNVSISNDFQLFAISPDASTGTGSVTFDRLQVYSASAK